MKYSCTELRNIMRMYQYTITSLAKDMGITKSYLSKIINRRVRSPKHERMIDVKITVIQKKEPKIETKKKNYIRQRYFLRGGKDIAMRNEIQVILDKKKITMTQLARDIGEAQSSVSQVISGKRHTERIEEKIIKYLKLDSDIFFSRTVSENEKIKEGVFVPLPTKAQVKERKKFIASLGL